MKLTIEKAEFEKQISAVIGAIGDGKNLPILSHILLTVSGDKATVSATDLSIEVTASFPIVDGEDGQLAVPAKKLHEITKELPSGEIKMQTSGNSFTIAAGKSRFNISALDGVDFPMLKTPSTEQIVPFGADALSLFLNQTRHAICADETKHNLCGTYIHIKDGKLTFCATNGHRLSVVSREKELPEGFLPTKGIIVPRKGVVEICKMADLNKGGGKVSLAHNNGTLFVLTDSARLAVRLVDADYPDYGKVIPTNEGKTAIINKLALTQALKRISLMSDETKEGKGRSRLVFSKGMLNISASNNTTGEASEEFEINYDNEESKEVNLNSRYILEALSALEKDEDVKLTLREEGKPVILESIKAGFMAIVMPMRA